MCAFSAETIKDKKLDPIKTDLWSFKTACVFSCQRIFMLCLCMPNNIM